MPETLYPAVHVARMLGETTKWVHRCRHEKGAPEPAYEAQLRGGPTPAILWTAAQLDQWLAFHASQSPNPRPNTRKNLYSDHKAVNNTKGQLVTWKLWWHNGYGGPVWWYSTPQGWYNSNDDGENWWLTGLDVRPDHFTYFAINGDARPGGHLARMLRSAAVLRESVERIITCAGTEGPKGESKLVESGTR